tara:strand:+ start:9594 stop:10313 length:720 start_codon:yes stop_codon:yes gene_type:complete
MLRANFVPGYFRRFLFVFIGCFAFAMYCLYDGFIGYPHKLVISKAYYEMPEENRTELWRAKAKANGWPLETPKEPEDIIHGIGQQWFMAGLCALIGLPALWKWFRAKGTWVEGDETRIRNSKGKELAIENITKINKRKWDEKGIATIYYDENGRSKKFVMDDFKYDREPMGQLMRYAEANLTDEQIVGGLSEVNKELQRKQEQAALEAEAREEAELEAQQQEAEALGETEPLPDDETAK